MSCVTGGSMTVFVRSSTQELLELQVTSCTTVAHLKTLIHSRLPKLPPRRQRLVLGSNQLSEDRRSLADCGVENEATLHLVMTVDRERAEAMERSMPIMSVVATGLGLQIDFLDDLFELGFDNDVSIPLLTRNDVAAAGAPAPAALRFLSRCLLLHALKFTDQGQGAPHWRAVAAMCITQQELKHAVGYNFRDAMRARHDGIALLQAGFTPAMLRDWLGEWLICLDITNVGPHCAARGDYDRDQNFQYTWSLLDIREAGATVLQLRQDELARYPRQIAPLVDQKSHPRLKYLHDFTRAGYAEAEVRAASMQTGIPLFARHDYGRDTLA